MARIKADAYNKARLRLIEAGSRSAAAAHPAHKTDGTVDEIWGKSLLREARDEFRAMDEGLPEDEKQSRMSLAHYNAVREAASDMGIGSW